MGTLRRTSSLAEILLRDKPTPKMFKNLLVPFVFGLAVAHTARADAGDTCSTHTDCVVSSGYASANPWASSEEFCYNTGTYNGVTVRAQTVSGAARDRMATRSTNRARPSVRTQFPVTPRVEQKSPRKLPMEPNAGTAPTGAHHSTKKAVNGAVCTRAAKTYAAVTTAVNQTVARSRASSLVPSSA